MAWFGCRHIDSLIDTLEAELKYFKEQYQHERQRAEIAVDELLRGVKVGPVSPPPSEPLLTETEKRVRALLDDPEFAEAGLNV